jgi:hypothetical protein
MLGQGRFRRIGMRGDLQTMKNDQKKRGFYGFNGNLFRETPFHLPPGFACR